MEYIVIVKNLKFLILFCVIFIFGCSVYRHTKEDNKLNPVLMDDCKGSFYKIKK